MSLWLHKAGSNVHVLKNLKSIDFILFLNIQKMENLNSGVSKNFNVIN